MSAAIIVLPRAASAPVVQVRRRGRLPKAATSVREWRGRETRQLLEALNDRVNRYEVDGFAFGCKYADGRQAFGLTDVYLYEVASMIDLVMSLRYRIEGRVGLLGKPWTALPLPAEQWSEKDAPTVIRKLLSLARDDELTGLVFSCRYGRLWNSGIGLAGDYRRCQELAIAQSQAISNAVNRQLLCVRTQGQ